MKPPPRTRSKPGRLRKIDSEEWPSKLICTWERAEQKQLLSGLRTLSNTIGSTGEIDYDFLKQNLPERTIPEITALVEALKAKVITFVRYQVRKQRREEERAKKPIELWTEMASTMTGPLEEPICAAFSQMFIVSSTEPRSLRYSDPPHAHPSDGRRSPGVRTIPLRPMPRPVVPGPAPTPAAPVRSRLGRISKHAVEDSPRALGMRCIVDFEKIYQYLSRAHNEHEEYSLTAMESAVVLDLLMSLHDELPLLDCNKLKQHMLQVYTELSAPAGSNMSREVSEDQRSERQQDGVGAGQEQITPGAKVPQSSSRGRLQTQVARGAAVGPNLADWGGGRTNSAVAMEESPGNPAAGDGAKVSVATGSATAQRVDGRAQSQSSESSNTFGQSGDSVQEKSDWEKAGLRPLNPFMVPLKLLARHPRN